jgi:hypothetical protein
MSIRAPSSCSICGLFGHNRRRCHEIIQDEGQRERRSDENFGIHVVIEQMEYEAARRRREQREQRERDERQQLLLEQSVYVEQSVYANDQQINVLRARIRELERQPPQHPQHPPPPRPQLRRSDSFTLTQDQVMAYILHQGNEYKRLLTKPEILKTPHPEVYVSESCPICMEALGKTNVTTMLCGHQTCTGCFARNIIESKSNRCPVCREKVI